MPPRVCTWKEDSIRRPRALFLTPVLGLAEGEGHIPVLDHVLDLPLHREHKESDKVHEEDWPEDREVEELEEGEEEGDDECLRQRIPELELWQPADEGTELIVLGRRQRRPLHLRVHLR